MINRSMSVAQRLKSVLPFWRPWSSVPVAILSAMLILSGCQKTPEAEIVEDVQTASTTAAQAPVANSNVANSATTANQQVNLAPLTILALGDSLTEGLGVASNANYPAQLEDRLQALGYKNAKVVNSGLSGETSTGLVNRLDWALQTKPDITILTIGANDAIRGLDVTTIEANIRTAVKRLQDNDSQVILGGMQIYDNLGNDYVKSFAAIYPRVANDMNIPLIPFFLDGVGGDPKLNQSDAIHPTNAGYTIIVDNNILPILQPEIEQLLLAKANLPASTATSTENRQ